MEREKTYVYLLYINSYYTNIYIYISSLLGRSCNARQMLVVSVAAPAHPLRWPPIHWIPSPSPSPIPQSSTPFFYVWKMHTPGPIEKNRSFCRVSCVCVCVCLGRSNESGFSNHIRSRNWSIRDYSLGVLYVPLIQSCEFGPFCTSSQLRFLRASYGLYACTNRYFKFHAPAPFVHCHTPSV